MAVMIPIRWADQYAFLRHFHLHAAFDVKLFQILTRDLQTTCRIQNCQLYQMMLVTIRLLNAQCLTCKFAIAYGNHPIHMLSDTRVMTNDYDSDAKIIVQSAK